MFLYNMKCKTLWAHYVQFLFIKNSSCSKFDTIKALHECLQHFLGPLARVAVSGHSGTTANGYTVQLHPFFASDVADILETEHLFCLMRTS